MIGLALLWTGYTLTWWGWNRITKCDNTLLDLIVPGREPVSRCAGAQPIDPGTVARGFVPGGDQRAPGPRQPFA